MTTGVHHFMISYVAILEPLAVAMPVLLLFSMATAAASAASVEEKKLPNFVMVLTDDLVRCWLCVRLDRALGLSRRQITVTDGDLC
eukprot:SAG11_NODE_723_length_7528_cov_4.998385_2_plen_86_part_00